MELSLRTIAVLIAVTVCGGLLQAAGTQVLFDPGDPNTGPFPTNALAVGDPTQKTGVRVNLPLPDCDAEPDTCTEISLVNELDGFNINTRSRVRFSGEVDVTTLRDGIFFVFLGGTPGDPYAGDRIFRVTPINQVLYDPETHTAYAKPDELLHQHSRYLLIVTDAIRDVEGDPVIVDPAYGTHLSQPAPECRNLGTLVRTVAHLFQPHDVVAASSFTTMSTTLWLEKARDALENTLTSVQMTGRRSVFDLSDVASITCQFQTRTDSAKLTPRSVNTFLLEGVGRIAFGSYYSPYFRNEDGIIPSTPTGEDVTLPAVVKQIQFNVYLPNSPMPPNGYPVVVAPGNAGGERMFHSTMYASQFARRGMAVIAIDPPGKSHGPGGKVVIEEKNGNLVELPLGGRGVDMNGDHQIRDGEGGSAGPPTGDRDCIRQAVLDLLQLVRAIKTGIDLDGDRMVDLDHNRIYYHGMSYGGTYGAAFTAVSPDVNAAVLDGARSTRADYHWRKGAGTTRTLRQHRPPLLNMGNTFDADYVLRDQPVEIIDVPGALAIQEWIERREWLTMLGEPLGYAKHLKLSPLSGVPAKRVLFQFGRYDWGLEHTVLIRSAGMRETTSLYRHDRALELFPELIPGGHYFSLSTLYPFPLPTDPVGQYLIAQLAQQQAAEFLASDGTVLPDTSFLSQLWFGVNLFETPPETLIEDLDLPPAP